jgi:hypothetical protein
VPGRVPDRNDAANGAVSVWVRVEAIGLGIAFPRGLRAVLKHDAARLSDARADAPPWGRHGGPSARAGPAWRTDTRLTTGCRRPDTGRQAGRRLALDVVDRRLAPGTRIRPAGARRTYTGNREGCSDSPLQESGWSGRHPHLVQEGERCAFVGPSSESLQANVARLSLWRGSSPGSVLRGGEGPLLITIGFVALATSLLLWLGRRAAVVDLGHVGSLFFLVGLMCLFLGVLKARDAAVRRDSRK